MRASILSKLMAAGDWWVKTVGSVTIFADRPFQVDELVKIGDHLGLVEEVGFRSTRIRYWLYHQVNEQVNLEIMKRFEAEQIEFAFPSQTLYLKKEQDSND